MKRGERGSCQMQMTSLGVESKEEGGVAVWQGGSPVYFFHSESTPPPPSFLYCPSVTAGVGNVKGRTKTSLLSSLGPWPHRTPPHLQKAEPTRRPTGTKSEAEHTPTDSTIFFLTCPKSLTYEPSSVIQLQTQIIHAFCCPRFFFSLKKKKDQTEKKEKKKKKIGSVLICHGVTLLTSCFLHTGILIYQELFRIQIQCFFVC